MGIKATILEISTDSQYEDYHQFAFLLADDDEDEGMVCFRATISEPHATFLVENTPIGSDRKTAYSKMVQAIAVTSGEDAQALVGREFNDDEE